LRTDDRNLRTRALELIRGTGPAEEAKTHDPLVSWSFTRWIDATKNISHRDELKEQTRLIVQAIAKGKDEETRTHPQGWFNQLAPQGADAAAPPVLLHEMRRPAPQRDFPDLYQSSLRRFSRRIVGTPRRRCQSINPQSF